MIQEMKMNLGGSYHASYEGYTILVELREDGWYWQVKDKDIPYPPQDSRREVGAEEAKKAAVACVGTLIGKTNLEQTGTLRDILDQIQWKELGSNNKDIEFRLALQQRLGESRHHMKALSSTLNPI